MTRHEARAEAQAVLPGTPVGGSVFFRIPLHQPGRRVIAQTLNQVAYQTFGARSYRMKTAGDGVWITRSDPMLHPVSQRRLRDALDRRDG